MKYIRTKDGIYEVIEFHTTIIENEHFISNYFCKGLKTILAKEVIDISLSIEELCDEFVAIGIPNRTFIIDEKDYKEQGLTLKRYVCLLFAQYENIVIYGAIWTDKGLIYVAKINDKGELELI